MSCLVQLVRQEGRMETLGNSCPLVFWYTITVIKSYYKNYHHCCIQNYKSTIQFLVIWVNIFDFHAFSGLLDFHACLDYNLFHRPNTLSPNARHSRITSLESMVTISSNTLVAMASQLSEAEERERSFSGRGRWNQLRSMGEAKSLLQYIFSVAADARLLWHVHHGFIPWHHFLSTEYIIISSILLRLKICRIWN